MTEIGGYFGLDYFIDNPYHINMIEFNSGRNALLFLVRSKNIKKLFIPYFLCDSISNTLENNFIEFEYYNIDENLKPIFNRKLKNDEYLYLVNYFGSLNDDIIQSFKDKFIRVIVDNTQSFFQKPIDSIDTLYSIRKYFGVPDGAYLYTNQELKLDLSPDTTKDRMEHILGRFEETASSYYNVYKNNDKILGNRPLKKMSKISKNILGAIDYEKVIIRRNSNYDYLSKKLDSTNKLNLEKSNAPFCYPYYVENGLEIKKILAQSQIYIPTLWPNVVDNNSRETHEYKFAANILPLPCDQRYSTEDMSYMVNTLNQFI